MAASRHVSPLPWSLPPEYLGGSIREMGCSVGSHCVPIRSLGIHGWAQVFAVEKFLHPCKFSVFALCMIAFSFHILEGRRFKTNSSLSAEVPAESELSSQLKVQDLLISI